MISNRQDRARDQAGARRTVGRFVPVALFLGLLTALLGSGCAYYNTFYFARKYYAQAEKSVARSESDKLPPDAAKKYDDAIKQCSKIIAYHSGSRWIDDAVYLTGACYYGKHEYETALKKFDELKANFPKSKLIPWAEYMSGLCHFERRDYELMDASFRGTLELDPEFPRRDNILFTRAKAAETRRDLPEAIRRYRELVRQFPKSNRSQEGLLHIGDLYFDAGHADSAYASYQELIRTARTDQAFQDAQIKAADALVRLGRPEEAIRQLQPLIPKEDPQVRSIEDWPARARIHLAQAYSALGQHEQALKTLKVVTQQYSGSNFAPEAQYQIGYTYEVYLDSLEAAREAYKAVGSLAASSIFREQAAARANDLAQLQQLSTAAAKDTASGEDKQAEAALKIAELHLFSQNRVEEALQDYRGVVEKYPETRMAPRAAYAVAWIHLNKTEGTRDSALTELRELIAHFPASRQARGALDLLAAENADTSGLRSLLVAVQPDTVAEEATSDTAASLPPEISGPMPPDSIRLGVEGPDGRRLGPGAPLSRSMEERDEMSRYQRAAAERWRKMHPGVPEPGGFMPDSLGLRPGMPPWRGELDSLGRANPYDHEPAVDRAPPAESPRADSASAVPGAHSTRVDSIGSVPPDTTGSAPPDTIGSAPPTGSASPDTTGSAPPDTVEAAPADSARGRIQQP